MSTTEPGRGRDGTRQLRRRSALGEEPVPVRGRTEYGAAGVGATVPDGRGCTSAWGGGRSVPCEEEAYKGPDGRTDDPVQQEVARCPVRLAPGSRPMARTTYHTAVLLAATEAHLPGSGLEGVRPDVRFPRHVRYARHPLHAEDLRRPDVRAAGSRPEATSGGVGTQVDYIHLAVPELQGRGDRLRYRRSLGPKYSTPQHIDTHFLT